MNSHEATDDRRSRVDTSRHQDFVASRTAPSGQATRRRARAPARESDPYKLAQQRQRPMFKRCVLRAQEAAIRLSEPNIRFSRA